MARSTSSLLNVQLRDDSVKCAVIMWVMVFNATFNNISLISWH